MGLGNDADDVIMWDLKASMASGLAIAGGGAVVGLPLGLSMATSASDHIRGFWLVAWAAALVLFSTSLSAPLPVGTLPPTFPSVKSSISSLFH